MTTFRSHLSLKKAQTEKICKTKKMTSMFRTGAFLQLVLKWKKKSKKREHCGTQTVEQLDNLKNAFTCRITHC